MSSIEDNKDVARRWLDLVARGRVDELCAMTAPTWKMHGGPPTLPPGPDGIRALFRTFGRIDQTWTVEDVIAEGDKVAVRATNVCLQESFLAFLATAAGRNSRRRSSSTSWTGRCARPGTTPMISGGYRSEE